MAAAPVFDDGFESGSLAAWTGSAGFTVQSGTVRSGAFAGQASSTGAPSQAWRSLGDRSEIWTETWVRVIERSSAAWLVGVRRTTGAGILLVGLDAKGTLMAKNVATNTIYRSTTVVPSGTWLRLEVHVSTGAAARFDVSLAGTPVPALSRTSALGTAPVGRFVVGDPNRNRRYRVAFDDVSVRSDAGSTDVSPPSVPSGLVASVVDARSVDLSWTAASDDTAVTGYTVLRSRNGGPYARVADVTGTSFTDVGLEPSTAYRWVVEAFDAAGNRSNPSDPATATTPSADDPAQVGKWSAPLELGVVGVHTVVLHTGEVLFFFRTETAVGAATLFDPMTGQLTDVSPPASWQYNMFCSATLVQPDGDVFVAGGQKWGGTSSEGDRRTAFFDPDTNGWSLGPSMTDLRWYPTVASLPDGDALILAGTRAAGSRVAVMERFDVETSSISTMPASATLDMMPYPRMFALSDGRMVRVGQERTTMFFGPATSRWSSGPDMVYGARKRATFVQLPGSDRILAIGGAASDAGSTTATTEILDATATSPSWRPSGSMHEQRRNLNAVLLPDGTVLAVGGNRSPDLYTDAVVSAELFDPTTERWKLMASQAAPRAYHSTAVLLPDGRVLSAGQNRGTQQTTAEIYSPPYLFAGPRPIIASAPQNVAYATSFTIGTPDAAAIDDVVLIRPGSVTHGVNFDQRSVPLSFSAGTDALVVDAPSSGREAPPGWYMAFLVRDGVPSVASWVLVS